MKNYKKFVLCLFPIWLVVLCCSGQITVASERQTERIEGISFQDSLVFWKFDGLNSEEYSDMMSLNQVLKKYCIKNGRLYDKVNKVNVSGIHLQLKRSALCGEDVSIVMGLPVNHYYNFKGRQKDWRFFKYDTNGNLDTFTIANYTTQFNRGAGYWKDFYFEDLNTYKKNNLKVKEEGRVKKNFKYGEWKYYNENGTLDSIKNYTLKDSIDVRFPHCIFNKKEPCY
ncbi:hypothetical protein [Sinomicrobium weinanense]|uniref:hypothetical protein n=1 Tax=Sinomicrobium weinanense TaxID=2842200 RepID=UPI001FFDDF81|nr:hypothetical protein [Sinomicrobium weinanense]